MPVPSSPPPNLHACGVNDASRSEAVLSSVSGVDHFSQALLGQFCVAPKIPNLLKSDYLLRFGITARQFNAVRIQLQGKLDAVRELLPVEIENLQAKIRKAKKTIAKLAKRIPGSNRLHQKRRRLACLELRFEQLEADYKAGSRRGPKPGPISSSCWARRTRRPAARAAWPPETRMAVILDFS
jgi:hypothetical protein